MFAYGGCRGHILHAALLVGALSSRHSVPAAAITDGQEQNVSRYKQQNTLYRKSEPKITKNVQLHFQETFNGAVVT